MAKATKLELVREAKLHKLLIGENKKSRLEASGVFVLDDSNCVVAFDNEAQVALIDLSLETWANHQMKTVLSPTEGFESIAYDPENARFFLLVEAIKDVDGKYRGLVSEYDRNFVFQACFRLETAFAGDNKGFEGLAHVRREGSEQLWALCEGNDCRKSKKGFGRIHVYARAAQGRWEFARYVTLPASASFRDYAGIALRGKRVAVVSQESRRLWLGELDESWKGFRDEGEVYAFPSKGYGNVEGVSWLSDSRLVCVSDRMKGKRKGKASEKDQSIHVFDIPTATAG